MVSSSKLKVSIVTPDGTIYEGLSSLVICKTTEGEIGIMANHIPLVASLVIGAVKVQKHDNIYDEIAIGGGFLEFSDNMLYIISNVAEKKENIDFSRAERAKINAQKRIKEAQIKRDKKALAHAKISLQRAINRIKISKR